VGLSWVGAAHESDLPGYGLAAHRPGLRDIAPPLIRP
jgi:hypothetical protein